MIRIGERRDTAAALHAADPFADARNEPRIQICSPSGPAVVLGSRQIPDVLDVDEVERRGLDIVRRRSGGGAVLLHPDDVVWVDIIVPHGVAPDDVRGSMVWAGECWRAALVEVGADDRRMGVHTGGMIATPWSDLVCFAGLGPGEVTVGADKLVGLSQRRTRDGIRVQGQVHRRSLLEQMPALFAVEVPGSPIGTTATLDSVGLTNCAVADLGTALATAIGTRITSM